MPNKKPIIIVGCVAAALILVFLGSMFLVNKGDLPPATTTTTTSQNPSGTTTTTNPVATTTTTPNSSNANSNSNNQCMTNCGSSSSSTTTSTTKITVPTPEFPLGALLAVIVPIAAIGLFAFSKRGLKL
jgi:cytoskeletal protein RodZ